MHGKKTPPHIITPLGRVIHKG